jgi:nicotinamide phosphoribosyltransferase
MVSIKNALLMPNSNQFLAKGLVTALIVSSQCSGALAAGKFPSFRRMRSQPATTIATSTALEVGVGEMAPPNPERSADSLFANDNPILWTDSYKASQYNMFFDKEFDEDGLKERLVRMYAFIEARTGGKHSEVVVAGIQHIAKKLASVRVTAQMVDEAESFYKKHFGVGSIFNRIPWDVVVRKHGGRLPLRVNSLPEGTIVPLGIPMVTIESTDEDCAQLVSHFEGLIQKAIWYPTTVATTSLDFSKVISAALDRTTTLATKQGWLPFALQDFGYRGASSEEAAQLGGVAHLYISKGSDTVTAVDYAIKNFGGEEMPGYSVAACEHNQMMSKGRAGEFKLVKRLISQYPSGILSVVADTFDLRNFVDQVSKEGVLRNLIMSRSGTFVIRPDSQIKREDGSEMTPAETISDIFATLGRNLGTLVKTNDRGFKVLDSHYKVIYGDGLNVAKIADILAHMERDGWSAENIVFGVGGNLLQKGIDRDTDRFAMKASEQEYEITTRDGRVYREIRQTAKETPGKESKKGRFQVVSVDGAIQVAAEGTRSEPNLLRTYFLNGEVVGSMDTLPTIRERINAHRALKQY